MLPGEEEVGEDNSGDRHGDLGQLLQGPGDHANNQGALPPHISLEDHVLVGVRWPGLVAEVPELSHRLVGEVQEAGHLP